MRKIIASPLKKLLDKKEELHWSFFKKKLLLTTAGMLSLMLWQLLSIPALQEMVGSCASAVALGIGLLVGRFFLSAKQWSVEYQLVKGFVSPQGRKAFITMFEKAKCQMDSQQQQSVYNVIRKWRDNHQVSSRKLFSAIELIENYLPQPCQELHAYGARSSSHPSIKGSDYYTTAPLLHSLMSQYEKSWFNPFHINPAWWSDIDLFCGQFFLCRSMVPACYTNKRA